MNKRVDVWDGDGKTHLGQGELIGCVAVYFWRLPDGTLRSCRNAEERPPEGILLEAKALGWELVEHQDNPKILLDTGEIRYGCQVWWKPIGVDPRREAARGWLKRNGGPVAGKQSGVMTES